MSSQYVNIVVRVRLGDDVTPEDAIDQLRADLPTGWQLLEARTEAVYYVESIHRGAE